MKTLKYKVEIEAPAEKVWSALIDSEDFKVWCAAFAPGSFFEGNWETGAEILFLAEGMGGTVAKIKEFKPFERIVADHIATLTKDRVRETTGDMTEKWIGTREIYELEQKGESTLLKVEIHTDPAYEDMFEKGWQKALPLLKGLIESKRRK